MKVRIIYDDGKEEEVELNKVEVIKSEKEGKNYAHFKYVRSNEPITIIHIYVPTNESPTVTPVNVEEEIKNKVGTVVRYKNVADELISRAKIVPLQIPRDKCYFCGDPASNQYNNKQVCSTCFSYLTKYGENSVEFRNYLNRKLMNKLI
ncbi:hypothetical protein [Stygiolobus caldivivus]|uniref:Uncharacterized protein n=1 Tax=Stygiolobus caldivivus TaxID=2824673 RepID=A0A8D5U463_9CREN|nr:hypothetical protein [Stygiolobus caldivivus]BCU69071.1 hypothetical protein KN1_03680 [Stygiolobus caldivivus]